MAKCKSVIFLFLFGGPSQLETFDMKPEAPEKIRGPYRPIASRTPDLRICEHLPKIADVSDKFCVIRTMSHSFNDHSGGLIIFKPENDGTFRSAAVLPQRRKIGPALVRSSSTSINMMPNLIAHFQVTSFFPILWEDCKNKGSIHDQANMLVGLALATIR